MTSYEDGGIMPGAKLVVDVAERVLSVTGDPAFDPKSRLDEGLVPYPMFRLLPDRTAGSMAMTPFWLRPDPGRPDDHSRAEQVAAASTMVGHLDAGFKGWALYPEYYDEDDVTIVTPFFDGLAQRRLATLERETATGIPYVDLRDPETSRIRHQLEGWLTDSGLVRRLIDDRPAGSGGAVVEMDEQTTVFAKLVPLPRHSESASVVDLLAPADTLGFGLMYQGLRSRCGARSARVSHSVIVAAAPVADPGRWSPMDDISQAEWQSVGHIPDWLRQERLTVPRLSLQHSAVLRGPDPALN